VENLAVVTNGVGSSSSSPYWDPHTKPRGFGRAKSRGYARTPTAGSRTGVCPFPAIKYKQKVRCQGTLWPRRRKATPRGRGSGFFALGARETNHHTRVGQGHWAGRGEPSLRVGGRTKTFYCSQRGVFLQSHARQTGVFATVPNGQATAKGPTVWGAAPHSQFVSGKLGDPPEVGANFRKSPGPISVY